ncbi:MAG: TRAP transporter substrate-binding protein [Planctomycetes bacterium]|nr:TRAP transporter substrate-binding protein [Planctomycetota bacterium]
MNVKKITFAILFVMAASVAHHGSTPAAEDVISLKIGNVVNEGHSYIVAQRWMAEELKKRTNGRLELEIYTSNQLGNERDMYEGVQMGSIDICTIADSVLTSFIPEVMVLNQPFLFNSEPEVYAVLYKRLYNMVAEKMRAQGVHLVGCFGSGFRNVYSKRPINKIEDFRGMKLRTMENQLQVSTWNAIGLIATPLPFGEVFTAMQQGTIDGAEGPVINMLIDGNHEITKHLVYTNHLYTIMFIGVSDRAWNRIPSDLKPIFQQVMDEGTRLQHKLVVELNDDAVIKLKALGVTFHDIDRAPLQKAIESAMIPFRNNMNKEWLTVLESDQAEYRAANP